MDSSFCFCSGSEKTISLSFFLSSEPSGLNTSGAKVLLNLSALSDEQKKQRDELRHQVSELKRTKRAFASTWGMRDDTANLPPTKIFFQGRPHAAA